MNDPLLNICQRIQSSRNRSEGKEMGVRIPDYHQ